MLEWKYTADIQKSSRKIKQILVQKNFKRKFITAYQKQNLKQDIRTIKNPSTKKSNKYDTQLSNELWKIKASKEEPVLVWKMLGQYQPYNVNTKRCLLCLNEKLQIAIYRGNNMMNKWTEIIRKCRHRNKYVLASYDSMDWNIRCNVEVSWDYWNFWSLWQSVLLLLWSKLTKVSSISINFKSRCILYDVYSTHVFTIIHVDTFHRSKWDFPVTCVVTSFKIRNHYIVANLTVAVHSAEDCCATSMKLWVPKKKRYSLSFYLSIIYIHIYIYIYIHIYIHI